MKEFLPWSKTTYELVISKYKQGRMSIIDVQLNGKCNYNCIYCDSPNRNLPSEIDLEHLTMLIRKDAALYDWMFICGLGEPLWAENKTILLRLLELCRELEIKCTIFTNGSQIDDRILDFVRNGILYPIIKVDTFAKDLSKEIYGTKQAEATLTAIEKLFEISHVMESKYCHVAASIVPTSKNIHEILDIIKRCIDNNVFPLLGQLEYAGNAKNSYNDLLLTHDELMRLKEDIGKAIGEEYKVPICPSVIAGLHITNDGYISVDKVSGLSCSWFWLKDPDTKQLCNVNQIDSFYEADQEIMQYRESVIEQMAMLVPQIEEHPFGGCGGNIKDLAQGYVKLHR